MNAPKNTEVVAADLETDIMNVIEDQPMVVGIEIDTNREEVEEEGQDPEAMTQETDTREEEETEAHQEAEEDTNQEEEEITGIEDNLVLSANLLTLDPTTEVVSRDPGTLAENLVERDKMTSTTPDRANLVATVIAEVATNNQSREAT